MTLKFERGTSPGRHPWFIENQAPLTAKLLEQRYGDAVERHETLTENFGLLKGWLRCIFWTVNGDPSGVTMSSWQAEA